MLDQCKKGRKRTGNISKNGNLFTIKKDTGQDLSWICKQDLYGFKHFNSFYLQDGPTHIRRTLRRFIERSPQPERERRAGGRSSRGYLHVEGRECSAVRNLLLVVRLGPQSHAWGSCPWRKPSRAAGVPGRRSGSRTGCRTHTNQFAPPKVLSRSSSKRLTQNQRPNPLRTLR